MIAAIGAVKSGVPVKRAAEEHCVPRTTLRDRLSGRVVHGTKPGPKPYLSNEQEVSPGPSATLSPGPLATLSPGPSTTVSPGPSATLSPGSSATLSPGPLNTVSSAVAGPSKTVISVPASSFHHQGERARGGISSSPQRTTPTSMKTLPRARLLTSSDVIAEMEEKEKTKKLALEENARRKTEREVKRKQREEEQKQKVEERERKRRRKE